MKLCKLHRAKSILLPNDQKSYVLPHRHFQDEALSASPQEATGNALDRRLATLPVFASNVANVNASVENRWGQVRDVIQLVARRARRQYQNCCDDNEDAISNLPAEKNSLHKFYGNRLTDDNIAVFYCGRRLVQRRLREMPEAWMARKTEKTRAYTDRNE
nr:unnamed protein product [Spirometra erinaceieuropaei]